MAPSSAAISAPSMHITPELQKSTARSAALASLLSTIFSSSPSSHDQPAVGRWDRARRSPARRPRPWPCGRPRPAAAGWPSSPAAHRRTRPAPARDALSAPAARPWRHARCPAACFCTTVGCGAKAVGHVRGAGRDHAHDPARASVPPTLASTWRSMGQPASGCRTFGRADFMRVPAPAASTTTAMGDFMSVRCHGAGGPARWMC